MPRDKAHLCSGKDWPAESASGLYTNGTGKHGHSRRIRLADWFESAAFFVLLLVVAMRPLLSETYESYRYSLERLSSIPDVTSPATTLWFDLAVWLSAVLAVVAVLLKGVRWRWTGLEPGWFFLLTGAVISTCFAASNRRIATTASADWLTAVVLICLLANLCRDRLRVNLVLAVLLASGTASVAKDIMQVKVEFEETRQYYEQEIKNRQASHADEEEPDSQIKLYVARMNAGEAYGFFPYSNAQGAWLGLCGFAALAMLGNKARYRSQQALFVVLAVVLFASIAMTGSKGGLVAVAVGLLFYGLLGRLHRVWRPRWKVVFAGAWLAGITAVVSVVLIGWIRGGLPTASLHFRWQYWQVTSRIIADHFWTGVGALNFGSHYLLHKPVLYPEEIKDPHSFILAIIAQWGILGAIGMITILLGGSWAVARAWGRQTPDDQTAPIERHIAQRQGKRWAVALIAGFVLLRFWIQYDLWSFNIGGRSAVFFDLGCYGIIWCVSLIGLLWLGNEGHTNEVDRYRIPLLSGVIVFLLHNTIDHSIFYPGTLTAFAAMCGLLLARVQEPRRLSDGLFYRWLPLGVAFSGCIGFIIVPFLSVARAAPLIDQARSQEGGRQTAIALWQAAARADKLDPTPLIELAMLYAEPPKPLSPENALENLKEAIKCDPNRIESCRFLSALLAMRFHQEGAGDDLWAAIDAARRCVSMYPESPEDHVQLADLLASAAGRPNGETCRIEACQHYGIAIRLNDARPSEEPRRWSSRKRRKVEERMTEIEQLMASGSATKPAKDNVSTLTHE